MISAPISGCCCMSAPLVRRRAGRAWSGSRRGSRPCRRRAASRRGGSAGRPAAAAPSSLRPSAREVGDLHRSAGSTMPSRRLAVERERLARCAPPPDPRRRSPRPPAPSTAAPGCGRAAWRRTARGRRRRRGRRHRAGRRSRAPPPTDAVTASSTPVDDDRLATRSRSAHALADLAQRARRRRAREQHAELLAAPARDGVAGAHASRRGAARRATSTASPAAWP